MMIEMLIVAIVAFMLGRVTKRASKAKDLDPVPPRLTMISQRFNAIGYRIHSADVAFRANMEGDLVYRERALVCKTCERRVYMVDQLHGCDGSFTREKLGELCDACGWFERNVRKPESRLSGYLLPKEMNFHDLLDAFEGHQAAIAQFGQDHDSRKEVFASLSATQESRPPQLESAP